MSIMSAHTISRDRLDALIADARNALLGLQQDDGHWLFELEADTTIPSEYVLLRHFLDDIDPALETRIARYLRARQTADGGWPLFHDGDFDISASVKAYYALKIIGDDPNEPHMITAREAILKRGGAAKANVFTRFQLALYGQIPWRGVPVMPVEIMLLPSWFPFHLSKVSYWSRTVIVPLLILNGPEAPGEKSASQIGCARTVSVTTPEAEPSFNDATRPARLLGVGCSCQPRQACCSSIEPRASAKKFSGKRRSRPGARVHARRAPQRRRRPGRYLPRHGQCWSWPTKRSATPRDDAGTGQRGRDAIERSTSSLAKIHGDRAYCQPCLSPIWDTGLGAARASRSERGPQ